MALAGHTQVRLDIPMSLWIGVEVLLNFSELVISKFLDE
jgi:hypothetical protein